MLWWWQGQMDYMSPTSQLQAGQYGQYGTPQQYGQLYGAQQLQAQYGQYSPQQLASMQQPVRFQKPHC